VLIEKKEFDPSLKHCSNIYYGHGIKNYIPKMGCIRHEVIDGKITPNHMGIVLFEVYDEPLEFRKISDIPLLSLTLNDYATGNLGFNSDKIKELMSKTIGEGHRWTYRFKFIVD
jgi:hypothetical protein